jgi:dipeptidyl aminopeptidase/acylaminoacyl peptidase
LTTGEFKPVFPGLPNFRLESCTETLAAPYDIRSIKVRNLRSGTEMEVYQRKRPTPNYGFPKLSPDGRAVAFMESLDPDTSVLQTLSSSGGPARELARAKAPARLQEIKGFAWSPDNRFVYFLKRADSRSPYELYRVAATGGTEESMGLKDMELQGLEIAPDGKKIAFVIGPFRQTEIWAMDNFLPKAK